MPTLRQLDISILPLLSGAELRFWILNTELRIISSRVLTSEMADTTSGDIRFAPHLPENNISENKELGITLMNFDEVMRV